MLTPRKFVSVRRTIDAETGYHILDAIADDGSAWWMVIGEEEVLDGWCPLTPLPAGSPPD